MSKIGLSIVIPVYNAEMWIKPTIQYILDALEKSNFESEIIVVDDGSTDLSADNAASVKVPKGTTITVMRQANTGRYLARKAGVEASKFDNILFIDSRVYIDSDSLIFLSKRLQGNPDQLWNGHVNIDKKGNIFARFWDAIVCIAWRRYFRHPKTTSYGIKDFDYYPKGTGFFYVPKKRLRSAMEYFEKTTNDVRNSSDDTLLIRYMNKQQKINLSPEFSCTYHSRSTFGGFLKHAFHRGEFFIDGFLRPGTRFFAPLIAVLVLSVVTIVSLFIWPLLVAVIVSLCLVLFIVGLLVGALAFGVVLQDALSLAVLGIPFALIYLAGLWRGAIRKIS